MWQLMKQLVHTMFITNNHAAFCFWEIEEFVKILGNKEFVKFLKIL